MKTLVVIALCGIASSIVSYVHGDEAAGIAVLRAGCAEDAQRLCAGVQPGGGRILACLKQHQDALSDKCKQAAQQAGGMSGGNPAPTPPSAPPPGSPPAASAAPPSAPPPSAPPPNAPPAASIAPPKATPSAGATSKASASKTGNLAASDAASGSYLRMKKAQIMGIASDAPNAQPIPVVEMLIPTTWDLKGQLRPNGSRSGCLCDAFAISWEAKSADGTTVFTGIPNYSWQYSDDPQQLQKLNDPHRRTRDAAGKFCPVSKPLTAEQFFRENLMPLLPSGTTLVSIDPYPELNQMARQQMGLGPNDTPSNTNNNAVRTDAVRAHVEFQKDNAPMEAWCTVAVVMRTFRVGRGYLYDLHAIDLMSFTSPKGKLAGNDKLLRVMMTSVRPTPEFTASANKIIANNYDMWAKVQARHDQINADLQNDITQTYRHMSDNSARVSRQGFLEADQNIRDVQTYRDPSSGQTMELSNQYGHAWLNGNNEYIMSDDPNFNPNAQLSGSWNELQAVRPSP
jgi:hypothetical protein